jgi:hypothetical protein
MGATTAERARPKTGEPLDVARVCDYARWCGTCAEAREPLVVSEAKLAEVAAICARFMAAARERRAQRSRYERQLNIPAAAARTHERGTPWRQHEMCAGQWATLQQIRAKDRERRARKRERELHDAAAARDGREPVLAATDVAIAVTWADGQVTRHRIRGLPDLSAEALQEELEQDLASWLDPDDMPLSAEGWALGWASIELADA